MKKVLLTIALLGALTGTAIANNNATSTKAAKNKSVATMTCEEFLLLDEVSFPIVVGIASGTEANKNGVVNVAEVEELTPIILMECKQTPKASFMDKVKAKLAEWKKKM